MTLRTKLVGLVNELPYVRGLYQENKRFRETSLYPPGHYYSPIIAIDEVKEREAEIWGKVQVDGVEGIDLQTQGQVALLKMLSQFYPDLPFSAERKGELRYYFNNDYYTYTDAIVLYSMMRHAKPRHIIEIGSGFSSALMLDTNELFFDNTVKLTFIEPYPKRLNSLLKKKDLINTKVIERFVQSVDLSEFDNLAAGDILFIDSTHIIKTGSDVNHILFSILPRLKAGVLIHFHDIFYPFEYPKEWVFNGWNWNEDYFLRAFLMYNPTFKIKLFSQYIHQHHSKAFEQMPLCYKNHGGNLWLEKQ